MNKNINIFLVICFAILLSSCSSDLRKPQSSLDTPENHAQRGLRFLNVGKLEKAKGEFEVGISLDFNEKNKATSYAGLGLYYAFKGDDKSFENADKAVSLNDDMPMVHTIYGRVYMEYNLAKNSEDQDWFDDAKKEFVEAIDLSEEKNLDKDLATAYYYLGIASKKAYHFREAKDAFAKVIELKNILGKEADEQYEIVQKIERAKPGTKIGSKIALLDKVNRAEIAVLFIEELKILDIFNKMESKTYDTQFKAPVDPIKLTVQQISSLKDATDIDNHWAKNWIYDVLKEGIMEASPDHKFYPNIPLTKAEYAQMLVRLLALITHDKSLMTKHFGDSQSMFPDVRSDYFAYNALAVCASRGIMKANMRGEIKPLENISGADALLMIRKFQHEISMIF